MDLSPFSQQLHEHLAKNHFIVFAAECTVTYHGRAESHLEKGDRVIIIKPDKTILIHQPTGAAPVNYMKEGAIHTLTSGDVTHIHIHHPLHKEDLFITLYTIYFFNAAPLIDAETITLLGNEKDMSDMIYTNPQLIEEGFTPLSREEHTTYGFIDVFGYDKNNVLVVVECKRYAGDFDAVAQLARYVERIKQSKGLSTVRGILACQKLSPGVKDFLETQGFAYKCIEPPKYFEKHKKQQKTLRSF